MRTLGDVNYGRDNNNTKTTEKCLFYLLLYFCRPSNALRAWCMHGPDPQGSKHVKHLFAACCARENANGNLETLREACKTRRRKYIPIQRFYRTLFKYIRAFWKYVNSSKLERCRPSRS